MCAGPVYGAPCKPLIFSQPTGIHMTDLNNPAAPAIEALRSDELEVGETYDSWLCSCCDSVMAIARRAADSDPFDLPDAVINITCLDCEATRPYRMQERRVRRYPWPCDPRAQADNAASC